MWSDKPGIRYDIFVCKHVRHTHTHTHVHTKREREVFQVRIVTLRFQKEYAFDQFIWGKDVLHT